RTRTHDGAPTAGVGAPMTRMSGVRSVVLVDDRLRDATAFGDLLALLLGPGADLRVEVAVLSARGAAGTPRPLRAGDPAGLRDVRGEGGAQPFRVLVRQLDLVRSLVESEADGFGRVRPVDVVSQNDLHFACHASSSPLHFRRPTRGPPPTLLSPTDVCIDTYLCD